MKKYIPLFLILLILASCAEESPEDVPSFRFTAYLDTIIQDWEGQDVFIREYRSLTGIDLEIIQPPHQQYMEKLMVSFNDTNGPEVCEVLPEYMSLMVSRDLALPLDEFIASSHYIREFEASFIDSLRARDGSIYGFPFRDGGGCVSYIRQDWLDNLGLEIPKNWEEFHAVLRAFTFDDPDGNGIDDTWGYTDMHSAGEDWYNRAIMQDARVEIYFRDGEWVDGFTEEAMKEALKRLRTIYREGLVDPNITTNTTFTARNRFISGDVGVITYWGNHWARNLLERTKGIEGEGVRITALPPLEKGYYIKRPAPLLVITRGAKEPGRIFRHFFDRQFDRSKLQTLFTYGVRGYHWDYEDGEPRFLINKNDPYKAPFTKAFVPPVSVINDWDQPMKQDEVISPVLKILNGHAVQQRIKFGKSYYDQYYLEIERNLKQELISRIINGELEIEEGLTLYREEAEKLFLQNILDELNGRL